MQYFLGLAGFQAEPLFDTSVIVHFRKHFSVEEVSQINEYISVEKTDESNGIRSKTAPFRGGQLHLPGVEPAGSFITRAVNWLLWLWIITGNSATIRSEIYGFAFQTRANRSFCKEKASTVSAIQWREET